MNRLGKAHLAFALLAIGACDKATERLRPRAQTGTEEALPALVTRSRPLMGTVFQIRVQAEDSAAEPAIKAAFDEIERLEHVLSEWLPDSEISNVNKGAGRRRVVVGDDVFRVVSAGMGVSRQSNGAFDLSWAALRGLYDFSGDHPKIPTAAQLKPKLKLVDWRQVELDEKKKTVFLRKRDMAIGTGGIAKGYALDRAGAILRAAGIASYMIFGGGQVQVHGMRGDRGWRVGIQHPRDPGDYFGSLEATGGSFSTSGDYERAFIDDNGKRWHHIIDTKTGYPANRTMSVTVMSAEGLYADALSTAAFVLGPEAALKMLAAGESGAEAVIVGADCELYTTPRAGELLRLNAPVQDGRIPGCTPGK